MDPNDSRHLRDLSPVLRAFRIGGAVFAVLLVLALTLAALDLSGVL